MQEKTNLYNLFKEDNLVKQEVYKSKILYEPVYINEELYEELFNEKFSENAFNKIKEMFSITLDKNRSNDELIGYAYVDKQSDPLGISLSGNLGSGRSFLYGKCFNIKGDKTKLAVSKNEVYSNGKYALPAAIKEAITSNIISEELPITTFKTLAILDTCETYDFVSQYLDLNDKVKDRIFSLPSVIEIRVNKDKELYRISNSLINNDEYTWKDLNDLTEKLAMIESSKIIKRYLHGSWSVGNISTEANLIDFDTFAFVKGRSPQFSNTFKYKASFFGYESLGAKKIIELLVNNDEKYHELEEKFNLLFQDGLKNGFCELIGITNKDYVLYKDLVDELFDKFMDLSKLFYPNYYDLNVYEEGCNNTFIYDFSSFFKNYLSGRKNENDLMYGVDLLINNIEKITYKKIGFIKGKVDEFFKDYMVDDDGYILEEAINFIKLYDKLFDKFSDLKTITFKQYLNNLDKKYIYCTDKTYDKLSSLYTKGKITDHTLSTIINHLVKTNINSYSDKRNEYLCHLELYDDYLTYKILTKEYYQYVLVPFSDFNISFAKLLIDNDEYMFHHSDNSLYSDKVYYDNILDIEKESCILINGKDLNLIRYFENLDYDGKLNNTLIRKFLKEYYEIDVTRISKINGCTSECYKINTSDNKYFLKVFEKDTTIESLIFENNILKTLLNHGLNVTKMINTKNNKIALKYNKNFIALEEYIEGHVYTDELPNNILIESAEILGKIHNILSKEYTVFEYDNVWNNYDSNAFKEELLYLKEKASDSDKLIKEILDYKESRIPLINMCYKDLNDLTMAVRHGDYSKRQIICNDNKIVGVIDFTGCGVAPVAWELIRSFFFSIGNNNFDYDLFIQYVSSYLNEFTLNNQDLKLMPSLLQYQLLVGNHNIEEYIKGDHSEELLNYIKLKYDICLFLDKEKDKISKELTDKFGI